MGDSSARTLFTVGSQSKDKLDLCSTMSWKPEGRVLNRRKPVNRAVWESAEASVDFWNLCL